MRARTIAFTRPPHSTHPPTASTFLRPVFVANLDSLRCRVSDISTVNLTVASLLGACSLLIKLGSFNWIGTGSGADTVGSGGLAIGNAASGVSDAVGLGAGDTKSGVGGDAVSFVPKTNSSIPARVVCVSWCSFQRSHDFLKQSAVLFTRIWGWLTAQIPHRSCLTRRISNHLFLVNDWLEHFGRCWFRVWINFSLDVTKLTLPGLIAIPKSSIHTSIPQRQKR